MGWWMVRSVLRSITRNTVCRALDHRWGYQWLDPDEGSWVWLSRGIPVLDLSAGVVEFGIWVLDIGSVRTTCARCYKCQGVGVSQ